MARQCLGGKADSRKEETGGDTSHVDIWAFHIPSGSKLRLAVPFAPHLKSRALCDKSNMPVTASAWMHL